MTPVVHWYACYGHFDILKLSRTFYRGEQIFETRDSIRFFIISLSLRVIEIIKKRKPWESYRIRKIAEWSVKIPQQISSLCACDVSFDIVFFFRWVYSPSFSRYSIQSCFYILFRALVVFFLFVWCCTFEMHYLDVGVVCWWIWNSKEKLLHGWDANP